MGWEEKYRNAITKVPKAPFSAHQDAGELSHRIDYCQMNLSIIQGRTPTLAWSKPEDDTIDLKHSVDPDGDDDIQNRIKGGG